MFRSYQTPWSTSVDTANLVIDADDQAQPIDDHNQTHSHTIDRNPNYSEPPLIVGFDDISVGEACRATSSAPTYFEDIVIKGVKF